METSTNCNKNTLTSINYSDVRQKLLDDVRNITELVRKGNVLTNDEREKIKTLMNVLFIFVQYSPVIVNRVDGLYVKFYYNTRKLTFWETLAFRLFGTIPQYCANEVIKEAYRKGIAE